MRFAPSAVVREMYFTGGPLTAEEALQYGLVNATFEAGTELAAARELAMRIAAKSPVSLRIAKEALNAAEWLPVSEGYALEQTYTLRLARTPDGVEAARAFLEKRDPIWERSSSL
jgi:enoyl-CoA hydratase/carnithine racemase